jgi:hypothetical protein
MLQLYGNSRSRAMRCLWMLEEIGEPYQLIEKSTRADDLQSAKFLGLNGQPSVSHPRSSNRTCPIKASGLSDWFHREARGGAVRGRRSRRSRPRSP